MIEDSPMIELLAQIRQQWFSAVNDAWFNWRFIVGFLIPPSLFFVTARYRWGGLVTFPFAAAGFWLFISIGICNVSDVMAETAVTEDEMDLACADTGRNFAPILTVPPASLVYTLLSMGGVIFVRAIFQTREKPGEASCPNCGRINATTTQICPRCMQSTELSIKYTDVMSVESDNPYRPPCT